MKGTNTIPFNILLVEDEAAHRELIRRKFNSYGDNMVLSSANSLGEAKDLLVNFKPDLAIIDYNMPDGKGLDLLNNPTQTYPVVMMTSHGDEELAVKALKSGAFDYVVKSPETLSNLPKLAERAIMEWTLTSERKKAEKKLKKQYGQLKKINTELDRFVYSASHDLRAPLLSILGLINITKMELDDKKYVEYLEMMEKSIKKLDNYIGDITNYSRNNRLEVEVEEIKLKKLINDIIENYQYMDGFNKILINVDVDKDLLVYSDTHRLRVILNNLISNAIKYHDLTKKIPFIRIQASLSNNNFELKITDNGKGISNEHLHKVFKMFYRASDQSKGSGLGLYITKETTDKLKGDVKVTSNLGKGSEFKVIIPNLHNDYIEKQKKMNRTKKSNKK